MGTINPKCHLSLASSTKNFSLRTCAFLNFITDHLRLFRENTAFVTSQGYGEQREWTQKCPRLKETKLEGFLSVSLMQQEHGSGRAEEGVGTEAPHVVLQSHRGNMWRALALSVNNRSWILRNLRGLKSKILWIHVLGLCPKNCKSILNTKPISRNSVHLCFLECIRGWKEESFTQKKTHSTDQIDPYSQNLSGGCLRFL